MDTQAASTEQGRRTRDAIVEAAADLMYRNGVAATSVDKVLNACGAGKSQMYHYFKNKDQLVDAVIDLFLERILANQPNIKDLRTFADFDHWAETVLDIHRGPLGPLACPLGNVAGELGDDEHMAKLLDKAYTQWESYLANGIVSLRDKGEVRADTDAGRVAQTMMACLQGGLLLGHLRRDLTPIQDSLAVALTHLRGFEATAS
ncbi:DNA-binding transcriptional regulator, AcrR family [Amycolatopsis xylanica]|uniref:DNA-binding transcriptional regulator, AcrR family n=1 Tax=Amycolatopsis xylanica TaxID=589385 RepID=A0A1H2ZDX2_9PSEU|nr:TetR/AcrR family transcriptional regulator [Amycolatopsis xylanica]SDX15527.1 DNA-binding transcriptional regulator, AcrR family [Amycolatopsis xylanica]